MRLTLRHLLAYMDELVDPTLEAQEIKRLVEESDFAKQLIERIRAAAARGDLPAPQPQGPQNKHDPNRTAEYLDRVLPTESVEEVEKLCLNSDVLLAELGDCHHILKLILAGPPHFESSSRDRMYLAIEHAQKFEPSKTPPAFERPPAMDGQPLSSGSRIGTAPPPEVVEAAEKAAAAALGVNKDKVEVASVSTTGDPSVEAHERPEVPDYLRDDTPSWQKYAPLIAVVALLAVGIAFWQVNQRRQQALLTNSTASTAAVKATPVATPTTTAETSPAATAAATSVSTAAVEVTPATTTIEPVLPATTAVPAATAMPAVPPQPTVPAPEVTAAPAATPVAPIPAATVQVATTAVMPAPSVPVPAPTGAPLPAATPEATPPKPEVVAVPRMQVGDYTSTESVLFNLQKGEGGLVWKRLPPRSLIYSGDHLAVMPPFRGTLDLTTGLQVEMLGGTLTEVLPLEMGVPGLRIVFGRVVFNCDTPNTKVRVQIQGKWWTITLADVEAEVALEVYPLKAEGLDPEMAAGQSFEGMFFITSGQVVLQHDNVSFQPVMPPSHGLLLGLKEVGADQPVWVNGTDVPVIDQKAAVYFEKGITTDQSGVFRLKELEQDRRAEVRSLALRGLSMLGEYEPLVRALTEEELPQRTREEMIVHLRGAVATSPENARAVKASFEKVAGATDGAELFKMLWGYSPDNLSRGDGVRLVNRLEDEKFIFRSLAFWNLRNATGLSLLYRPEAKKDERDRAVKRWREKLDMGLFKPAP